MLGDSVNTSQIDAEIGSGLRTVSGLVGISGLNPYSYYGPGQLNVDGSKNIILTPQGAPYKLGDFRRYNHTETGPAVWALPDALYYPFGQNVDFVLPYMLKNINLYAFATRGDYIQCKFYHTAADRLAETNLMWSDRFAIPVMSDTPLVGHTRQSAYKVNTTGWIPLQFTGKFTTWLYADDYVYAEFFISDVAGNRVINFGTARSAGFQTMHFIQAANPYVYGANTNIPTPPAGYTAIFPAVYSAATPVCSFGTQIYQTLNSNTYDFYVDAKGIYGSTVRIVALDSVNIILTKGGVRTVCATGLSLSQTSGRRCTGTLSGGGSWTANTYGAVTFESATIQGTPLYTQC